ncbi:MAG: hypothetical protein IKX34_05550 [Bacteroidales bacterium]|nr:hypothetical protein [Bacteroidales bacterium]
MKKMTCVVLMLCIAMMCTTPFEAQSQNRRTGGGNSGNATKKEQPATRSSQSSSTTSATRSSEPKTKMVTPSGQTQRQNQRQAQPANRGTQTTTPKKQNNAPAQVQDRRPSGSSSSNSNSHSAQISRKNSDVGRQNIPASKPNKDVRPNKDNRPNGSKPNAEMRPKDRKPNAVQYHSALPAHRGPEYARPYLEPKHKPMPSYRYGDHYFGHRIHSLPRNYVVMRIGNVDYYYCDGIYYRRYWLGGYYVCRPPRGTAVTSTLFNVALTAIAINTIRDEIARARRAAAISTGYGTTKTDYVVRTSDDYLNTNLVNQAGQDYYYQDGVFYILKNGQYYVIEPPIGALVTEIPNDYDEVEIEGRTYYQVEDTLYKATVIDGALYFEVVCNL